MLVNVWAVTSGYHKGAKVEAHQCRDGSVMYGFRDRIGRPANVSDKAEADFLIKEYRMEDVTEQMRADGWIA